MPYHDDIDIQADTPQDAWASIPDDVVTVWSVIEDACPEDDNHVHDIEWSRDGRIIRENEWQC